MAETNHKLLPKKSPPAACGHGTGRSRDELQVRLDPKAERMSGRPCPAFLCPFLVIGLVFSRHAEKAEPRQPQASDCRVLIRIVD